jgi:hypothetical protein
LFGNCGVSHCAEQWNRGADFQTKDLILIQDSPAVFDRTVQVAKLRTDLETSTANAEQCGVPITTVIRSLLEMAEWWCGVANDRGVDLSARVGGVRPMIAAIWFCAGAVTGIIGTIGGWGL